MTGQTIRIAVQDDGRGFDAEAIFEMEEGALDTRSKGLVTLKERFELVNGTASIQSSENDGTLVRLELAAD